MHPERELPDALVAHGGQAHLVEHLGDPGRVDTGGVSMDRQLVAGPAARVEPRASIRVPTTRPGIGQVAEGLPEDESLACGGRGQPEQHPDGGRLAGTVGSEEPGDAPRRVWRR